MARSGSSRRLGGARVDGRKGSGLILVVEDAFNLYDLVGTVLDLDPNVETARAKDAEEALEMARAMRPDLVILDIRPPDFRGMEVARLLKADPLTKTIPLVAVAVELPSETVSRACDHCVTRPYDLAKLVKGLRENADSRLKPGVAA
jgi:CheY-like chemotaxis protein